MGNEESPTSILSDISNQNAKITLSFSKVEILVNDEKAWKDFIDNLKELDSTLKQFKKAPWKNSGLWESLIPLFKSDVNPQLIGLHIKIKKLVRDKNTKEAAKKYCDKAVSCLVSIGNLIKTSIV